MVVVPTYNEVENISLLIPEIFRNLPGCKILVVDDGSPDGTAAAVKALMGTHPGLLLLERAGKGGLASAVLDGMEAALEQNPSHVLAMDSDFSHPPERLPDLVKACEDADLVLGTRYQAGGGIEGWAIHRRILSEGGNLFARFMLSLPYHDLTGGFKCYRADLARLIVHNRRQITSTGYIFQVELTLFAHRNKARIKEVPFLFRDRQRGKTKFNERIILEALKQVVRLRFRKQRSVKIGVEKQK